MTTEPSENGYRKVHLAELREALVSAWARLHEALPAEARAIEQYETNEKSQEEIALEEGVRRQTVNRRIARARVFLQMQLADFLPYQSA
ncbi:MAG TPA: sigma factor-like helix-turn-helix DNA-binding protein [Candidatus Hydrogenedentes bacterium]|nr:sigma factor-like helix-turn-helix DNA-binding protein [Candidatus Hydrogenedentota bacterium]